MFLTINWGSTNRIYCFPAVQKDKYIAIPNRKAKAMKTNTKKARNSKNRKGGLKTQARKRRIIQTKRTSDSKREPKRQQKGGGEGNPMSPRQAPIIKAPRGFLDERDTGWVNERGGDWWWWRLGGV
jgi:hypothetical protein